MVSVLVLLISTPVLITHMSIFSIIDHFLLSKTLFTKAVDCVCSLHDTDHEPVVLHLSVKFDVIQYVECTYLVG